MVFVFFFLNQVFSLYLSLSRGMWPLSLPLEAAATRPPDQISSYPQLKGDYFPLVFTP